MKAVVFKGPGKVVVEDRPIPKIKDPGDIIVKVDKVHCLYPNVRPIADFHADSAMWEVLQLSPVQRQLEDFI